MPVTREQFDDLIAEGLTVEEIADFDKKSSQTQQPPQGRPSILAQLVRSVMKNAPTEQLKTSQYALENKENIPTPQEGQSLIDYVKNYQQVLRPREQEIAQKGTVAQFEEPITAGLAVSGATAPLQTAKALGKFGILEGLSELTGLNKKIQNIQQPELRDIADIAKVGAEGAVASQPWKLPKSVKTVETKIAGRVIDSLIKPRHKEFMFGKNPGEAVAKEGIVANNLGNLKDKVDVRIKDLRGTVSDIRNLPENFEKKIDVTETLKPLKNAYTYLKSIGEKTHATELKRIENALSDLQSSGKDLTKLNISETYQLKEAISSMQDWTSESPASHRVNVALRKAYHLTDLLIDKAIPQLEVLNSRISNLISAKQAIDNRIEVLRRSEPMPTLLKILDLPFATMKTTLGKTVLANLLSEKFKKSK